MNGVSHYPAGTNAFQNVPPKGTDKPLKPPRKRHKLTAEQKTVNSLIVSSAEKMEKATEFKHFGGIDTFGVTPDHMADAIRASKINPALRVRLGCDK